MCISWYCTLCTVCCLQRWIAYYVDEVLEVSMLFHNRTGMFFFLEGGVEASNPLKHSVVWHIYQML